MDSAITLQVARQLLSGGGASSEENPGIVATLIAWQVAVLFLGFVVITVVWEFSIALLTFITVSYTGRKALWISCLKEEILVLGVITLTLVVIEASLANICVEGVDPGFSHEEFPDHPCPEGKHLLFTRWRILQTHLLLFAVAVMFILYTCTSLYICIFRLRFWRKWEQQAKVGAAIDIGAPITFRRLCNNGWVHFFRMALWHSWYPKLYKETYIMLRLVFRLRMDACHLADPLPRQANFLNVVEQAMEVNFKEAAQYSWLLSVAVAVFLSIPIHLHALYWLFGISAFVMLLCAAKLQSVVVHLSAMAYFDFHNEIKQHLAVFTEFDQKHHEMKIMNSTSPTSPGGYVSPKLVPAPLTLPSSPSAGVTNGYGSSRSGQPFPPGRSLDHPVADSTDEVVPLATAPLAPERSDASAADSVVDAGTPLAPGKNGSSSRAVAEAVEPNREESCQVLTIDPPEVSVAAGLGAPSGAEGRAVARTGSRDGLQRVGSQVVSRSASNSPLGPNGLNRQGSSTKKAVWMSADFRRSLRIQSAKVAPEPSPKKPDDHQSRSLRALMAAGCDPNALQQHHHHHEPPPPLWRRLLCCAGQRRHCALDSRPPWHVDTEYEQYRHRVSGHLRDPEGKVVRHIDGLFWLNSPYVLLWLFQLCYMENSMSMAILLYGLLRDLDGLQREVHFVGIIVLLLMDVALLVFASTAVLPVYALINTAATARPQEIIEEIRVEKMLFDKEDYEEGIGGSLLRLLHIVPTTTDEEEEAAAHLNTDTEFILLLADQAGVVTAFGNAIVYPLNWEPLYGTFTHMWRDEAEQWHKCGKRVNLAPSVRGDMMRFWRNFMWLDKSSEEDGGSGFGITARELALEMRGLGTRCTVGELNDMIAQVDMDGSGEIGFQEYILFMCFKFFDHDNDGVLDIHDIQAGMAAMGDTPRYPEEMTTMVKFLEHGNQDADWNDGRPAGRVELDEFLRFFLDVNFEHEAAPIETPVLGVPQGVLHG